MQEKFDDIHFMVYYLEAVENETVTTVKPVCTLCSYEGEQWKSGTHKELLEFKGLKLK